LARTGVIRVERLCPLIDEQLRECLNARVERGSSFACHRIRLEIRAMEYVCEVQGARRQRDPSAQLLLLGPHGLTLKLQGIS
jgi:hypothetical protein